MDLEVTRTTTATSEQAWAALVDVESWPRWTKSMTEVRRVDSGDLRLGSQARIRQPGLPPAIWTVSELEPGQGFSWAATGPGIRTVGHHRLSSDTSGSVTLWLGIEQRGPLGAVLRRLLARKTERFLNMEVNGWKAASEAQRERPA